MGFLLCLCSGFLQAGTPVDGSVHPAEAGSKPAFVPSDWNIKTNLLYDALLLPSLEVEYRFTPRWSVAVEGNVAWWSNKRRHRYYQLAVVTPEVRYWFRSSDGWRGHYVGLLAGGGLYDLSNGKQGYQGEGFLAGLSYGFVFPIGKRLALEAGAALGFVTTQYDEYHPDEGHAVYMENRRTTYFGPVRARLALVWNLPWGIKQKGGRR